VQDEEGAVYVYDLTSRKSSARFVRGRWRLRRASAVDDGFFVLRSDVFSTR